MISSKKPVPQAGTRESISALYQMVPAASSSRPQIVYHVDMAIPALVQIPGNGQEVADMKPGEKGFLRAIFQDGEERIQKSPTSSCKPRVPAKQEAVHGQLMQQAPAGQETSFPRMQLLGQSLGPATIPWASG